MIFKHQILDIVIPSGIKNLNIKYNFVIINIMV